jgi:hypothetical protein
MKRIVACVVGVTFALGLAGAAVAKDKDKNCKGDGTRCTKEELKQDKKAKEKQCVFPCETTAPDADADKPAP